MLMKLFISYFLCIYLRNTYIYNFFTKNNGYSTEYLCYILGPPLPGPTHLHPDFLSGDHGAAVPARPDCQGEGEAPRRGSRAARQELWEWRHASRQLACWAREERTAAESISSPALGGGERDDGERLGRREVGGGHDMWAPHIRTRHHPVSVPCMQNFIWVMEC